MTTAVQVQYRRGTSTQVAAFTGAAGELAIDTTNNRVVVQDGATAGGFAAARLSEVITNTRTQVNDAAYAVLVTDRLIAYIALTAARVVTLPAASAFPTGSRLLVIDKSGACSATSTITVSRAGSDTVSGTTAAVIAAAYGYVALECNGSNKWTIVDQSVGVVAIIGGTIDNAVIGGVAPAAGSFTSLGAALGANGSNIKVGLLEQLVTCSGPSSVSTIQIPNRAIVLAVSVFVISAVTGATSFNVDATTAAGGGAGTTAGQFGATLGVSTGSNNAGVIGPTAWYAASTIKLTANGSNFTGGTVRVSIQYMTCGAPTS